MKLDPTEYLLLYSNGNVTAFRVCDMKIGPRLANSTI